MKRRVPHCIGHTCTHTYGVSSGENPSFSHSHIQDIMWQLILSLQLQVTIETAATTTDFPNLCIHIWLVFT
jgi:hypothetical protein